MCSFATSEIVQSYIKRVLIIPPSLQGNQYEQHTHFSTYIHT